MADTPHHWGLYEGSLNECKRLFLGVNEVNPAIIKLLTFSRVYGPRFVLWPLYLLPSCQEH